MDWVACRAKSCLSVRSFREARQHLCGPRRIRLPLLLLTAASLAGCQSLKHTIEPERILPRPSETLPIDAKGGVSCDALQVDTASEIPTEIQSFIRARYCAERSTGDDQQRWIRRFVEKGVALSDRTCSLFFDDMEHRRVDAGYAQTNMNIAGTAVTAVLAASGNHTRSIFNVATALALGNAWFENYKTNFVLTPSLGKLHDSMYKNLRRPLSDEVLAKAKAKTNGYETLDEAVVDVQQYDQLCSHKAVVMYLEKAVENAEVTTFPSGIPAKNLAAANVLLAKLYKIAAPDGTEGFTAKQSALLYIIATADDATRKSVADAATKLAPELGPFIAKLMPKLPDMPVEVLTDLVSIGELLNYESDEQVRQTRLKVREELEAGKSTKDAKTTPAERRQAEDKRREDLARVFEAGKPRGPTTGRINFSYEMVRPSERVGR